MRPGLALALLAACGISAGLHGCGSYFLPGPTAKQVRAADVIGSWRLEDSGKVVTLNFEPDGTFSERVTDEDGRALRRVGGVWSLNGPRLLLDGYLSAQGGQPQRQDWYFTDSLSGLTLLGSNSGDPDTFGPLHRLPSVKAPR